MSLSSPLARQAGVARLVWTPEDKAWFAGAARQCGHGPEGGTQAAGMRE